MRVGDRGLHLGYCTNIHPANGWEEVRASLAAHTPALKSRLGVDGPFGIGLRLSGRESVELLAGERLTEFADFLSGEGLYVFTINGFPHGAFHGQPVKADVHAPDWRSDERVDYTLRLAEILDRLLPDGVEGSISTNPLSYVAWVGPDDADAQDRCAANLARAVDGLLEIAGRSGRLIHLDVEPEADGSLSDCADLERFYLQRLMEAGARALAARRKFPLERAREALRDHVRICFDACHSAVAYEVPEAALDSLEAAGIRVGKVQVSSAVAVSLDADPRQRAGVEATLQTLVDEIYLHQVVQRNDDGTLQSYPDLPQALERIGDPRAREWRIHFHVPIFLERYAALRSTQPELRRVLELVQARDATRHLEIETYTWDVLPPELRSELVDSIAREYEWVLDVLD
jgi:sugar phosphate isomerase/epimerase